MSRVSHSVLSNVRRGALGLALAALTAVSSAPLAAQDSAALPDYVTAEFGTPPTIPSGPLSDDLKRAVRLAFVESMTEQTWGQDQNIALNDVATSGDVRLVWIISDMMRFVTNGPLNDALTQAASVLLERQMPAFNQWGVVTDHLIAWDIPEPPSYLQTKRAIFTTIEPDWKPLLAKGSIDWRHVSWGGVLIDNRPYDTTDEPCNCIPAADNPEVTSAAEATWLDDDDIVFGIEVNGAYRAYPRQIMEVREMVNDTLGGRDLGIPYCTLCGAAQAYFTDDLPSGIDRPVLRTSGLLIRSNKVMYDITSGSVFDTFTGEAVTGKLKRRNVHLPQATVITSEWGAWKAAHPETTVLAEHLALGRDFDFRNNRDANGPIFPIGDSDPRLPVQEDIIGVVTAAGTPIAFQRSKALIALRQGAEIVVEDVRLALDAGGIRAEGVDGRDIGSHQAFWFAWSQFHPDTKLWTGS